jgi:hypothetical protein
VGSAAAAWRTWRISAWKIRYLDKLMDELAKGRSMEKILR